MKFILTIYPTVETSSFGPLQINKILLLQSDARFFLDLYTTVGKKEGQANIQTYLLLMRRSSAQERHRFRNIFFYNPSIKKLSENIEPQ